MSVKRLVGEPREKTLSEGGMMEVASWERFTVEVACPVRSDCKELSNGATAVVMRPEISESVAYCERVVVETYPLAEFKNEPSVKVNPPSPSARERICAPCETERYGVQIEEVAMTELALRLWYICRKPPIRFCAEPENSRVAGSIPAGGCRISTRLAGVLEENDQFAIMDVSGSAPDESVCT